MSPFRATVLFGLIILCAAFVYVTGVMGDDPINGPDPRVCAATGAIPEDAAIIDAALDMAAVHSQGGPRAYADRTALKASGPYVRFSSDWHWQRWQEDREIRFSLVNAGLQYAYTVTVAFLKSPGTEKPYSVETYRVDECARPIGDGTPISVGEWSRVTFERARAPGGRGVS